MHGSVQGSSEKSIVIIVDLQNEELALKALHKEFFESAPVELNIFLVGPGNVGANLLDQIKNIQKHLDNGAKLRVVAIMDSNKVLLNKNGINLSSWKVNLSESTNIKEDLLDIVKSMPVSNKVLVDCTSSEEVADQYPNLMEAGCSIVTPNKKFGSGNLKRYKTLINLIGQKKGEFLYETTVGSALPIISVLNNLILSGDKINKIEAILSGTLSYIFNTYGDGRRFEEVVREAKKLGCTEPDPREDLTGLDVARKALILARELGYDWELEDIKTQTLITREMEKASTVTEFLKILRASEPIFKSKFDRAKKGGNILRYIATIENGRCSAGLKELDMKHPFGSLSGTDNIVMIWSENYKNSPLTIKGPGAGLEITASGLLSDILKLDIRL